jgi:chromosome segregation ATPase
MASSPERVQEPLHIDITGADGSPPSFNNQNRPRSPGVALQNFFGWNKANGDDTSSNGSPSVSPQHGSPRKGGEPFLRHASTLPSTLDIPKANAFSFGSFGLLPQLPTPPATNSQVNDLERELKELSSELANSIRREMELEDEIERLKSVTSEQHPSADSPRRTSDYFSDSGASSSRYGDTEARAEEMEKVKRKAELEKAQMKLEMSEKMAEVLKKRRLAEDRIQLLEETVQTLPKSPSPMSAGSDRVRQLEHLLEDAKRKIMEEKKSRDNMEELIGGMRHEIQQYRTERDNYRDELVPRLENKISSLEVFLSEGPELISPLERPDAHREEDTITPLSAGLSRSRSVANKRSGLSRSNSVTGSGRTRSRANSVKEYATESREQLMERVKDMENQKDSLHKALRGLLDRHNWEEKQFSKRIQLLEMERDKALFASPRKSAYHREVKTLREEIVTLRRRANDALGQKWQCEKGLGGLRMDLDRAQQETNSLRRILEEHDIEVPDSSSGSIEGEAALTKAYKELQTTHALSMVHLKDLDTPKPFGPRVKSGAVLSLLKKSISDAEAERDAAHKSAEKYRDQARQLQKSELKHLSKQKDLSSELFASAGRMDDLAESVRVQISSNSDLRLRLVEAVERGQREQNLSASRIAELQTRLRSLEDKLVTAQSASDRAMSVHEGDVKLLEEGHRRQLHRSRAKSSARLGTDGLIISAVSSPYLSPLSPAMSPAMFPSSRNSSAPAVQRVFSTRSPRLHQTSSGAGISMHQATGASNLEHKVRELEKALADAEGEMKYVVGRMNEAQMEVASLQGERDEATMRSRRLQNEIVAEREKVQSLMARS